MTTWFISDTHFGHSNIVEGTSKWADKRSTRKFPTVEDHDLALVNSINQRVNKNDILYHLGDWSFGGKSNIKKYRDMINCDEVHLILGNHDHHIKRDPEAFGFASVKQYSEIIVNGVMLVLMHYPLEWWNAQEHGSLHLHGHVHGNSRYIANRFDVCPEILWQGNFGVPVHVESLIEHQSSGARRHAVMEGGSKFGD